MSFVSNQGFGFKSTEKSTPEPNLPVEKFMCKRLPCEDIDNRRAGYFYCVALSHHILGLAEIMWQNQKIGSAILNLENNVIRPFDSKYMKINHGQTVCSYKDNTVILFGGNGLENVLQVGIIDFENGNMSIY